MKLLLLTAFNAATAFLPAVRGPLQSQISCNRLARISITTSTFKPAASTCSSSTKAAAIIEERRRKELITAKSRVSCSSTAADEIDIDMKDDGMSPASSKVEAPKQKKTVFNILCLHGKGSSGEDFQNTLKPFEDALRANSNSSGSESESERAYTFNFKYIDAPFPMSHDNANDNESEMETKKTYQWWTLPPGVRSFNAKEYEGYQLAADKVYNELLLGEDGNTANGCDFIFGHSQGAILLSSLITSRLWREKIVMSNNGKEDGEIQNNGDDSIQPLGYIFNGCAWPNPFTDTMTNFKNENSENDDGNEINTNVGTSKKDKINKQPNMLFIIGEKDRINPPEGAIRVRDALGKSDNDGIEGKANNLSTIETYYHPAGHAVPVSNTDALNVMTKWVLRVADNANKCMEENK